MLYITGDTHGERTRIWYLERSIHMTWQDTLIICGDFGFVWNGSAEENEYLDGWAQSPYTVCFVDGNHENFDLLSQYPVEEWHGGKVHKIRPNIIHLMRGQVFTLEGKTFFTMGGAYSIDRYMRRKNLSYWDEELPSSEDYHEAHRNLTANHYQVDYVLTHTAPCEVIRYMASQKHFFLDEHDAELTGYLEYLRHELTFTHWYFGHFHVDWDVTDQFSVLFQKVVAIGVPRPDDEG